MFRIRMVSNDYHQKQYFIRWAAAHCITGENAGAITSADYALYGIGGWERGEKFGKLAAENIRRQLRENDKWERGKIGRRKPYNRYFLERD